LRYSAAAAAFHSRIWQRKRRMNTFRLASRPSGGRIV
jgi:hypothetical protein